MVRESLVRSLEEQAALAFPVLVFAFIYLFISFFHLTIPEAFLLVLAEQALTWKLPLSHRDSLYSLQVI